MNISSIQLIANEIGLEKYSNERSEKMLIRAIQKQRGEETCFATDKRYLCKQECEWSANCRRLRAVWLR